jgi:hypothetical protein
MSEQKPITETDVREALVKRLLKDREKALASLLVIAFSSEDRVSAEFAWAAFDEIEAWTTRKNDGL